MSAKRLRPYSHLFWQGLLACLAFMTPVFVVLYFVTVPSGPWRVVLAIQVIATVIMVAVAVAYFRVAIWVDREGITEVGFFGLKRRVARADIGSIVRAETFVGGGEQTVPQLFVCDHDGRQVVRLRGQFWSRENMEIVVTTLDVPVTPVTDAVSTGELRSEYPGLLYWFERHPVWAALAFSLGIAILGGGAFILLTVAGVPLTD